MRIIKRRLKTIASIFLFIWGIAACSTIASSPSDTVRFMIFGDPAEQQAYLDLVESFQRVYPRIQIDVTHIPSPSDYRTRLATEFASGDPPDITLMNYRRYASFAASGLLEPLGPLLEKSDQIHVSDFYAIAIDAFMWRGILICLPQNISSLVVYYNKDMFDEIGHPYPPDDWSWDDFLRIAELLTRDVDGDGTIDTHGLGVEPSLYRLSPFVWQNGGPIVDDPVKPTRLTLTRPPSLEALTWFVSLSQVHHVVPNRIEEASQDSESRFIAGKTAMFLNSRRGTPTYREIESFSWDVAPLPHSRESAGILHSDGYCLSKATKNKEAAWKFIEYANSFEGQSIIAKTGRTVPSLISVAESESFLDPEQLPARSSIWLQTVPLLRRVPVMSHWQEVEKIASEEMERAFYGDISPQEAASLAFTRTEEYFILSQFASEK